MKYLFINPAGYKVTRHSYSAGSDFRKCKRYFQLRRIEGYKDREKSASFEFGKAVEAGIQFFYQQGQRPGTASPEFKRIWLGYETDTELVYTDKEGDWQDLYRMGADMADLFECTAASLPITNPRFQVKYEREVFPGTEYAGITFLSYLDCLCDDLLVDIKTAAAGYDTTSGMVGLDPQLRAYAWQTGLERVAFLVLVKAKPDTYEKGDRVTLLQPIHGLPRGEKLVVAVNLNAGEAVIAVSEAEFAVIEPKIAGLKGNALKEFKLDLEAQKGLTPWNFITRCRIQYLEAKISLEDREEAGRVVQQEILDEIASAEGQFYPKEPGIRFPDNKCTFCSMRGICLKDEKLVHELLIAPDEQWMTA